MSTDKVAGNLDDNGLEMLRHIEIALLRCGLNINIICFEEKLACSRASNIPTDILPSPISKVVLPVNKSSTHACKHH